MINVVSNVPEFSLPVINVSKGAFTFSTTDLNKSYFYFVNLMIILIVAKTKQVDECFNFYHSIVRIS